MRTLKIAAKNAVELLASILFWMGAVILYLPMPRTFPGVLAVAGLQVVAFLCALNALLDVRRFKMPGRIFLVSRFMFMAVFTAIIVWDIGTITAFGLK